MKAIRTLYQRWKLANLQRQIVAVATARACLPGQLDEYVAQINRSHQHAIRIANKSAHAEQIRLDVELSDLAYQRAELRKSFGIVEPVITADEAQDNVRDAIAA